MKSSTESPGEGMKVAQRIDTWLWASRFFKSRKLANEAVRGGHVWLNGNRCKPARAVKPGDRLRIRRFTEEYRITIHGLSDRRLGAPLAAALYRESDASVEAREKKAAMMKSQRQGVVHSHHRPDRRDRERMLRVKYQLSESD